MKDFFDVTLAELEALCSSWSVKHAKTIYRAAYKNYVQTPWIGENLPRDLMQRFAQDFELNTATIYEESVSRYDGTVKFLVRLHDEIGRAHV